MRIRARFSKDMIEPLEPIDPPRWREVTIEILTLAGAREAGDACKATAGAWEDTIDCEERR